MEPYDLDLQAAVSRIKEFACLNETADPLQNSQVQTRESTSLFSLFMRIVADQDLSEVEARYHYNAILEHAEHLKRLNGRQMGYYVAMFDYLINIARVIECPKIMELNKYETLVRQSTTDELTGLYNRRYFNEQIERELYRARRYGQLFSLLLIDIDNFKSINDNHVIR